MEQKTETKLKAIRKADGDWLKAVQDRNLVKLATYYHDDATWLLPGEPTLVGKDEILGRWSKAYQAPGFHIEWKPFKVEVSDSLDIAVSVGHWNISIKTGEGSLTKYEGSYVAVWRKHVGGYWRVLVDISNWHAHSH